MQDHSEQAEGVPDEPVEVEISLPDGTHEDLMDLLRHLEEAGLNVRLKTRPEERSGDDGVLVVGMETDTQDHSPTKPTPAEIADILRHRQREEREMPAGGLALRWDNAEGYVDHDPETAWINFPWMGETVAVEGPEAAKLIRDDAEFRRNS